MNYLGYILNLPWTILALINLFFSIPYKITLKNQAIVFNCLSCGLCNIYAPKATGVTIGNIVIISKNAREGILEHELIHAEQYQRYPFIFQFMYLHELITQGYWNNKFEIEAYDRSNTWPKEKSSDFKF